MKSDLWDQVVDNTGSETLIDVPGRLTSLGSNEVQLVGSGGGQQETLIDVPEGGGGN